MANTPEENTLPPDDGGIDIAAGEYVLGVGDAESRMAFERMAATEPAYREAMARWTERLHALSHTYESVEPPAAIKQRIDERLFASAASAGEGSFWSSIGFWRTLSGLSMAALAALTLWAGSLYTELSRDRIEMAGMESRLESAGDALEAARGRTSDLETQLAGLESELNEARSGLEEAGQRIAELESTNRPILVVSLESGETDYRFLAVHEPGTGEVRMTLVNGAIEADRDFELWLVDPEADTVSLGVVGDGPTAIELDEGMAGLLQTRGLLAISVEQKGGSPTGVAQGPVVAVGKPQRL